MLKNFTPLRRRNYRLLWSAFLVSTAGDVFFEVGIIVAVFERTGSALQTMTVTVATFLPGFLLGPFAGAWVDRYSRRRLMIAADIASAGLVGALLLFEDITTNMPLLYAIVVGLAAVSPLRKPARLALIPLLVPRRELVAANSLMLATQQVGRALGFALGGVLVLKLGIAGLIVINTATFALAAIAVLFIVLPDGENRSVKRTAEPLRRSIAAGLSYLKNHPIARPLVVMEVLEHLPHGIWHSALMLVFTQQALGGQADAWGYQNSAHYGGTIVGATLAIALASWVGKRPGWAIIIDGFIGGLFTLGYALSPDLAWALLFSALMGPAAALRDVAQDALLQSCLDDEYMGRVQATRTMAAQLVFITAGVFFAWLADAVDIRWIYISGGLLYMLTGCYALSKIAIRRSRIE
ncbi:MAG: MFS transporter [Candidatus Latescibacteria bacterium]|nr:MFS transporter [Candidatus Latescibacterota bacterium]